MTEVILISGYPASGKSSLSDGYISKGYVHVNRDKVGGKVEDLVPAMSQALQSGKNVVLDNTFPTKESRKPFIEAAHKIGAKITSEWMSTSIEDAQFNVCCRMMSLKGFLLSPEEISAAKHPNLFPPAVLFKYRKEFVKPSLSEGFDKCNIVEFKRAFDPKWTRKAIFLDYDGTLRKTKSGNKWPSNTSDIEILPNRKKILESWKNKGYLLLGVSNQSGIAKNELTHEQAKKCFGHTNGELGINIDYYYCPHKVPPISCYCRKPMPGMAIFYMYSYKLDLRQCIMVGDMTTDETFAKRSYMEFIHTDEFFK